MRRQDSKSFLAEESGQLPAGRIQVDSDEQFKGGVAKLSSRSAPDLLLQAPPSLSNFHLASLLPTAQAKTLALSSIPPSLKSSAIPARSPAVGT